MADLGPSAYQRQPWNPARPSSPPFSTYGPIFNGYPELCLPRIIHGIQSYSIYGVRSYTLLKTRANPTPSAINAEGTVVLAYQQPPIPDVNQNQGSSSSVCLLLWFPMSGLGNMPPRSINPAIGSSREITTYNAPRQEDLQNQIKHIEMLVAFLEKILGWFAGQICRSWDAGGS